MAANDRRATPAAADNEGAPRSQPEVAAREGYRSLLDDSRNMRRHHSIARDAWFSTLPVEHKAEVLFEFEVLLKGLACFANPRNHPGPPRRTPMVALDFREPLLVARGGVARVIAISRLLLHEHERVYVFQRYLEHVIPDDGERVKLLHASSTQGTPPESLRAIRQGFSHLLEVFDTLARLPGVPFRGFYATLGLAQREVARNSHFNPIAALEFRPEFDRIDHPEVFHLVQSVPGDEAHRLVALAFLSLFRMLRYLAVVDAMSAEGAPLRAYLVLAALRSDARALARYLRRAGPELADGYERQLFAVDASALDARYAELLAEGHRILGIKGALEGIAAKLSLELRRLFEREIPALESPPADLGRRLVAASASLRAALQETIMFLCKALGSRLDVFSDLNDLSAKRDVGERLRRDVWMFAQIVRGFAAKAAVVRTPDKIDRWAGAESFRFVGDFLGYFRAMGYPLLRASDYQRFDEFIAAMSSLEDTDLLDPSRFTNAVNECEAFHAFLTNMFESISGRDDLAGTAFDKKAAAEALRTYLGDARP